MGRKPRFPGVSWYCDHCGASLNSQKGFSDHKYIWKCKKCGYKNSISWDNIDSGDSVAEKYLLHFLGFLSYIGFWTSLMLAISIFAFKADKNMYMLPLLYSLGIYIAAFIMSLIVEFGLRKTKLSFRKLLTAIIRNIKEDILAPLLFVKEILNTILSLLSKMLRLKKPFIWYNNVIIIIVALFYILIFIAEIVAFNRINGFSANDWLNLLKNGYNKVYNLITSL